MESLKRSMRYQVMETKNFLMKFIATLIFLNIFFYILNAISSIHIGFSLGSSGESSPLSVTGSNLLIIAIVIIVYNYERNYGSFPLAVSMGTTRKEYFLTFLADNILIALILGSIQGVLMKIDPYIMRLLGKEPIYDFLYFNIQTDSIFYVIFILFFFFLSFICFWNLIASLNYKFGYIIWIEVVVFNMLVSLLNIKVFGNILKSIGSILSPRLGISQIGIMFSGIGILYLINYLIVRKTNIKRKAG